MFYFVLCTKDGQLYDENTYHSSVLRSIENLITNAETQKLNSKLRFLEKLEENFDSSIDVIRRTNSTVMTKDKKINSLNRLLEDLEISAVGECNNIVLHEVALHNNITDEYFEIKDLRHHMYRNLFRLYKDTSKKLKGYNFNDHFEWRKVQVDTPPQTKFFSKNKK